tara:strand:+ start:85 stop:618 length:534 start_codon:yes stop_codon:yes gene_type:complete
MALDDKKYEKFYKTDGTGNDKIKSADLTNAEAIWDLERATGCELYLAHEDFGPLIFQMQQMQDEITALRDEISDNKDKTTFPGFGTSGTTALVGNTSLLALGTSSSTALAGNTTVISSGQASAITANTAKVSLVGGTGTALSFGEMITKGKGKTATYSIVLTAVKSGVSKSATITLI